MPPARPQVPVRTIVATIAMVLATFVGIVLVRELARIIAWLVVAAFIAVALSPAVEFLVTRARLKRAIATLLVFLVGVTLVSGMTYTFVRPLVEQSQNFAEGLPEFVEDAQAGRGAVGRLVKRYNVDDYIEQNQERLRTAVREAGGPALDIARTIANTLAAFLTILVLAFLMILEGPGILRSFLNTFEPTTAERIRRVASDCAGAVTGYMAGNLLISAVAGIASFVFLTVAGVPFSGVLALWVAFADLIPLVGATLGAVPAVLVAFLHSTTSGVLTLIFFIAYQQFENHVLQVTIMSRTVKLNPLAVLASVLVGVELAGILGALLAIPAAGVVQVILRDIYDERRGRLKPEPTIGSEEIPVSEVIEREGDSDDIDTDEVPEPAVKKTSVAKKSASKKAPAKKVSARSRAASPSR